MQVEPRRKYAIDVPGSTIQSEQVTEFPDCMQVEHPVGQLEHLLKFVKYCEGRHEQVPPVQLAQDESHVYPTTDMLPMTIDPQLPRFDPS
jgi:hypothetical protein